jgi:hypothetical protein
MVSSRRSYGAPEKKAPTERRADPELIRTSCPKPQATSEQAYHRADGPHAHGRSRDAAHASVHGPSAMNLREARSRGPRTAATSGGVRGRVQLPDVLVWWEPQIALWATLKSPPCILSRKACEDHRVQLGPTNRGAGAETIHIRHGLRAALRPHGARIRRVSPPPRKRWVNECTRTLLVFGPPLIFN